MKISKIADIIEGLVIFGRISDPDKYTIASILTELQDVENPHEKLFWKIDIVIGEGLRKKSIRLELAGLISENTSLENPVFLDDKGLLIYFKDRLFMAERELKRKEDWEEAALRAKKAVYEEDSELARLRSLVANLEATIEFQRTGPRREAIPENVKLVVWARDGGACIHCSSKENLHFDHIIPLSKGGSNSELNVQILCQKCNLRKADKISML